MIRFAVKRSLIFPGGSSSDKAIRKVRPGANTLTFIIISSPHNFHRHHHHYHHYRFHHHHFNHHCHHHHDKSSTFKVRKSCNCKSILSNSIENMLCWSLEPLQWRPSSVWSHHFSYQFFMNIFITV